jgi:hypothetical protein
MWSRDFSAFAKLHPGLDGISVSAIQKKAYVFQNLEGLTSLV